MTFQWAVFFASLDPAIGSEQKGIRTVLIVSNEDHNQIVPTVAVLPLTSSKRRLYYAEISLPVGKAGQPLSSIIMAHQIRTISKQRLGKLLGYLEDSQIQIDVQNAIKEHLDMG